MPHWKNYWKTISQHINEKLIINKIFNFMHLDDARKLGKGLWNSKVYA